MQGQALLLLLGLGLAAAVPATYRGHKVLRMVPDEEQAKRMETLGKDYDFWTDIVPGRSVDIRTSPEKYSSLVAWLAEEKLSWSVMIEDVSVLMEEELVPANKTRLSSEHSMDWTSYHELADIYGWFDYLVETYDFCEQEVIGQSYEGQDMIVMKVCFHHPRSLFSTCPC